MACASGIWLSTQMSWHHGHVTADTDEQRAVLLDDLHGLRDETAARLSEVEPPDFPVPPAAVSNPVQPLEMAINAVQSLTSEDDDRTYALRAVVALNETQAHLDHLVAAYQAGDDGTPARGGGTNAPPTAATSVVNWITQHAVPRLKAAMSRLWTLLVHLLTPTGWSISGGIGSVLGLAQASIEIQFG
jgi:hypothetical protein